MRLGLLGYPIAHSLSSSLYRQFLGDKLESYELFEYKEVNDIPSLEDFGKKLHGLNITSPYKTHFIDQITIPSLMIKSLKAVNTLAFLKSGEVLGTNTDVLAVVEILKNYSLKYPKLKILLLGDGVMAKITRVVAQDLKLDILQFSRKTTSNFSTLDLAPFQNNHQQTLVINSCSRAFNFEGNLTGDEIFWDFNYSFLPHQKSLPPQVKSYQDGRVMLELQAKAAIQFWHEVAPYT